MLFTHQAPGEAKQSRKLDPFFRYSTFGIKVRASAKHVILARFLAMRCSSCVPLMQNTVDWIGHGAGTM